MCIDFIRLCPATLQECTSLSLRMDDPSQFTKISCMPTYKFDCFKYQELPYPAVVESPEFVSL